MGSNEGFGCLTIFVILMLVSQCSKIDDAIDRIDKLEQTQNIEK